MVGGSGGGATRGKDSGGGVGETLADGNESDLEKRKEGRKAETKTSDKENESVQRKWPRGAAPTEESPTAWCFLSSQRCGGRGGDS